MAIPLVYNVRSVKARWTSTIVAVVGIAGTVGVFVAMLSLARGFKATLVSSGSADNALITRAGATSEMTSGVSIDSVKIIQDAPGIARGPEGPLLTPESVLMAPIPVERNGIGAIRTDSGVNNGPSGPRAMPGASWMIFTESIETPLVISDVAPARVMSALSAEPDETSVALNPRASDSMATKTPTVPAIPTTATIVDVQRAFTLRTL